MVTTLRIIAGSLSFCVGTCRNWTAAKQLHRHPDVFPERYALVQRALDEGETFAGRAPNIVNAYLLVGGVWWRAVVKATDRELYLVSFHRVREHNVRRERRRAGVL